MMVDSPVGPPRFNPSLSWSMGLSLGGWGLSVVSSVARFPVLWTLAALLLLCLGIAVLWHPAADGLAREPLVWSVGLLLTVGLVSLGRSTDPQACLRSLTVWGATASFVLVLWRRGTAFDQKLFRWITLGVGSLLAVWVWLCHLCGYPLNTWFSSDRQSPAFWMAIAFVLSLSGVSLFKKGTRTGVFSTVLSVLLIGGVFFFPSRSGLIAAVVGATVFCFLRWGRTALAMGVAGIFGAGTLLSADQVAQFLKMQDALSFRRKDIWTSALRGIMEKPWGGWGPGQFETLYQHHAIPQDIGPVRLNIFTAYAHNDYLQLASEYGVPLALFFLGGVGYYFWQRRRKTSFLSGFSAALAGGAFCAFNHPLAFPMNALLWGGVMVFPAEGEETERKRGKGDRVLRWVGTGVLGFLALFNLLSLGGAGARVLGAEGVALRLNPWETQSLLEGAERDMHRPEFKESDRPRIESALWESLRRCPRDIQGRLLLAHWALEHTTPPDLKRAEDLYRSALVHFPVNAILYLNLSRVLDREGKTEEACEAAHAALRREPHYGAAILQLGALLRRRGDPQRAERWLTQAIPRMERLPAWGDAPPYPAAIVAFQKELFLLEIARCQLDQGRNKDVVATLQQTSMWTADHFLLAAEASRRRGEKNLAERWQKRGEALLRP